MEGESTKIGISISALNNMHFFLGFCVCVYEHSVFDFQPNFKAENENYRKEELITGGDPVFTHNLFINE